MRPFPVPEISDAEFAYMGDVKAGFPSPAGDVREKLDLVKLLVRHSASTFFFRIDGVSMVDDDDVALVHVCVHHGDTVYAEEESGRGMAYEQFHKVQLLTHLLGGGGEAGLDVAHEHAVQGAAVVYALRFHAIGV